MSDNIKKLIQFAIPTVSRMSHNIRNNIKYVKRYEMNKFHKKFVLKINQTTKRNLFDAWFIFENRLKYEKYYANML